MLKKKAFHARRAISSRPQAGETPALTKDKLRAKRRAPIVHAARLKPGGEVRVKALRYRRNADIRQAQGVASPGAETILRRNLHGAEKAQQRVRQRRWKMFRISHTVLLENAFCAGNGEAARMERLRPHCLLVVERGLLERVEE